MLRVQITTDKDSRHLEHRGRAISRIGRGPQRGLVAALVTSQWRRLHLERSRSPV